MLGEIRIFGFDRRQAKPLMREFKRAPNSAKGLVRMGVSWSDGRQKADSPFHAVLEISWIVRIVTVIVVGVNKGVNNTHNHDPMLKAP